MWSSATSTGQSPGSSLAELCSWRPWRYTAMRTLSLGRMALRYTPVYYTSSIPIYRDSSIYSCLLYLFYTNLPRQLNILLSIIPFLYQFTTTARYTPVYFTFSIPIYHDSLIYACIFHIFYTNLPRQFDIPLSIIPFL